LPEEMSEPVDGFALFGLCYAVLAPDTGITNGGPKELLYYEW
jgi:hypothetical protein